MADVERNINVTILSRQFKLKATSERSEQLIRIAVDGLNNMGRQYAQNYPDSKEPDILRFIALNVCMKNLNYKEEICRLQSETEALEREISGYLENIDGK